MSTRRVTRQQFSDSTTIDGNRLDAAFADVTDSANSVQRGDELIWVAETPTSGDVGALGVIITYACTNT